MKAPDMTWGSINGCSFPSSFQGGLGLGEGGMAASSGSSLFPLVSPYFLIPARPHSSLSLTPGRLCLPHVLFLRRGSEQSPQEVPALPWLAHILSPTGEGTASQAPASCTRLSIKL